MLKMSYKGKVQNGVVVLPPDAKLCEGEDVEVTPLGKPVADDFTDTLIRISKKVAGLPRDLAEQHDHYLYGSLTHDRHLDQAGYKALLR